MKSIYILLTKSDTSISKAISFVTADQYTHVSLSFDKKLEPMYSFARKYMWFPYPAGLKIEPLSKGFYKKNNHIPCALYELRVEDDVYRKAYTIVDDMMKKADHYKYSVLGLVFCKMEMPIKREYYYFCSEFVSEVLMKSGAVQLPKVPSLMRPVDYMDMEEFHCLYKGCIKDLVHVLQLHYQMGIL